MKHREMISISSNALYMKKINNDEVFDRIGIWETDVDKNGVPFYTNVDDINEWLLKYDDNSKYYRWGIFTQNKEELVGVITAERESMDESEYELTYLFGAPYIGKGYEKEAYKEIIDFLTRKVGIRNLKQECLKNNDILSNIIGSMGFGKIERNDERIIYCLQINDLYFSEVTHDELIFEIPLYQKIQVIWDDFQEITETEYNYGKWGEEYKFHVYSTYYPDDFKKLIRLISTDVKVHGMCPNCKKDMMWKIGGEQLSEKLLGECLVSYTDDDIELYSDGEIHIPTPKVCMMERINELMQVRQYIDKIMKCQGCDEEYRIYYKITNQIEYNRRLYIEKIGQFPRINEFRNRDKNHYRKLLKKINVTEDLLKATELQSSGYSVGAYVYLRRVIEKYVIFKYDELNEKDETTRKDFLKLTMNSKIERLKEHIPEILINNKEIYSILSKGIHGLSEEECDQYFLTLKEVVELVLIKEVELEIMKQREERLSKEVGQINTGTNGR